MVLAGTGKEGKTKEVVKDREDKTIGMYIYLFIYIYVICMFTLMWIAIILPSQIMGGKRRGVVGQRMARCWKLWSGCGGRTGMPQIYSLDRIHSISGEDINYLHLIFQILFCSTGLNQFCGNLSDYQCTRFRPFTLVAELPWGSSEDTVRVALQGLFASFTTLVPTCRRAKVED